MPRRYKQGADGQPHPAFYGKLPEEFSKADTMRFMVETDLNCPGAYRRTRWRHSGRKAMTTRTGTLFPPERRKPCRKRLQTPPRPHR